MGITLSFLPRPAGAHGPMYYLETFGPRGEAIAHLTWGLLALMVSIVLIISVLVLVGAFVRRTRHLAFLPIHWTGLMGMPRRIYTYPEGLGWSTVNLTTTIGAFVLAIGMLLLLVNVLVSLKRGAPAGPNPWDAPTLE